MGRRVIISWLLLIGSLMFSQTMMDRFKVPINFNIQSSVGYDSNYLKLSNSELNEISFYPELLGNSESASTLISKNSISLKYNPYLVNNHKTKLEYKISNSYYFASEDKTYSSFGFYVSQHLGKYEWLKWSYLFMPKYYLRDYRDRDDIIIESDTDKILRNCHFSQGSTTLSYSKWIGLRSWIEGIFNYKTQYYNSDFTEFDLNIVAFGIKLVSKDYKKYPFQIYFIQTLADNIAFQNGLITTDGIDRDYLQRNFSIKLEREKISSIFFHSVGLLHSLSSRIYTSNFKSDILHYNRSHTEIKFNLWLKGNIINSLGYRLDVTNRKRTSFSDHEWVENLKNFNKMEYYLTLSYSFSSDILY